jgi:hypothetical protein
MALTDFSGNFILVGNLYCVCNDVKMKCFSNGYGTAHKTLHLELSISFVHPKMDN